MHYNQGFCSLPVSLKDSEVWSSSEVDMSCSKRGAGGCTGEDDGETVDDGVCANSSCSTWTLSWTSFSYSWCNTADTVSNRGTN